MPAGLVDRAGGASRPGRSPTGRAVWPARRGRPFCRSIPAASSPSVTISPWVLASLVVRRWTWQARMPAVRRCSRVILRLVSA